MNCLWTDCRGSSSGAPSQDNRSITQQLHLPGWTGLGWAELGWAGPGWAGWAGWAGKGWDLMETQRPSNVRCWQWLTLDTGQKAEI